MSYEPYRYYDPDGDGKPTGGLYTKEQVAEMFRRSLPGIVWPEPRRAGVEWIEQNAVQSYRHLAENNLNNLLKVLK